jgi:hypothetical protein
VFPPASARGVEENFSDSLRKFSFATPSCRVQMAQNFDPNWAQHIKHDVDRPLGVDVPVPSTKWEDLNKMVMTSDKAEPLKVHDSNVRPPGAMDPSRTIITITMKIFGTDEELVQPIETGTSLVELQYQMSFKLGVSPETIQFVTRQGCSHRLMYPHEQVARRMTIKGIKSFKRLPHKYDNPKVIIGAGHIGLKSGLLLLKKKDTDFVIIDRMFRVGGTSWMYQANSTSKLQTEFGSYHLEYDLETPLPHDFTTPWPSRNMLLAHFERVTNQYGLMPYVKLNTNVKAMEVVTGDRNGPHHLRTEKYLLTLEEMTQGRLQYGKLAARDSDDPAPKEEEFAASSIMMYPGNLTLPRTEIYKGEELFGGDIGYGMFNEVDYHKLEGADVAIIGHGAFAVENIRTCCEFGCGKIYLVCRRRNLACPRVCSMAANRTLNPLANARYMKMSEPMYDLIGLDPWAYHSVQANEKRTVCQITQKARFGIGDIYFLSIAMGKVELIEDPGGVKRVSKGTVHLESGRKLEVKAILKLLGLIGEMDNDRLLKIKEMVGFWVNEDPKRYIVAEPVSVMCSQMGGTSLSPGAYTWAVEGIYFIDWPEDFSNGPVSSGMLPRHKADLSDGSTPRPAYVVDARHGTGTGMAVGMFTPRLQEIEANNGFIKAVRYRLCHPIRKFIAQAKEDWDYYAAKFLKEGYGPHPEYPYNVANFKEMYFTHMQESGEPPLPCDGEDLALCDAP